MSSFTHNVFLSVQRLYVNLLVAVLLLPNIRERIKKLLILQYVLIFYYLTNHGQGQYYSILVLQHAPTDYYLVFRASRFKSQLKFKNPPLCLRFN